MPTSTFNSLLCIATALFTPSLVSGLSLNGLASPPASPLASTREPCDSSRRGWLRATVLPGLTTVGAGMMLAPKVALATEPMASDPRCVEQSDPFKTVKRCYRVGPDKDGRYTRITAPSARPLIIMHPRCYHTHIYEL